MLSAFGATDYVTSVGNNDATVTCTNLANYAKNNYFDGVDLDWEDTEALNKGTGE